MADLHGRGRRLTADSGGCRPGQMIALLTAGWDDYKRYKKDVVANSTKCQTLDRATKRWTETAWKDVSVGDFILVQQNFKPKERGNAFSAGPADPLPSHTHHTHLCSASVPSAGYASAQAEGNQRALSPPARIALASF